MLRHRSRRKHGPPLELQVSRFVERNRMNSGQVNPMCRSNRRHRRLNRLWIDARRLVPLRVEKYLPSGQLARRIDTTRVATDDKGRFIPADLTVRGPREDSVTDLDGSRIRHDVAFTDRDFAPEGLTDLLPPPSASE